MMNVMSRNQLYTALYFLLPLIYYMSLPISLGDLAIWVALGRDMISSGQFVLQDHYSFLQTYPLIYPVFTLIVYGLLDFWGGLIVVSLVHKVAVAAALYFIYTMVISKTENPWSIKNIGWICFSLIGCSILFIDRPATLALVPFVISFLYIQKFAGRFSKKELLLLAVVLFIWVNSHGSWALFFVLFGWRVLALMVFDQDKKFIFTNSVKALGVFGLVSLLNPFGYKIYEYVLETSQVSRSRGIDEWNYLNFQDYFPLGYFYLALLLCLVWVFVNANQKQKIEILKSPLVILIIISFLAIRNAGLVFLVLIPFLYNLGLLSQGADHPSKKASNLFLSLSLVTVLILLLPPFRHIAAPFLPKNKIDVYDEDVPWQVIKEILVKDSSGRVYNNWKYGSVLAYSIPNKIFIDTRNIIYRNEDFENYQIIQKAEPGWESLLNYYQSQFLVLDAKEDRELINKVESSSKWKFVLKDKSAVLFRAK